MDWYRRVTADFMKTLKLINLLFLLLAACSDVESAVSSPAATIPSVVTLSPQPGARQKEITALWESGIHAQLEQPVECDACHEIRDGLVIETTEWVDVRPDKPDLIAGRKTLCGRCHAKSVGGKVHLDFTCTSCHDSHTVRASCTESECHTGMQTVFYEIPPTPTDGHPNTGSSFCGGANCHPVATAVVNAAVSVHGSDHANVSCVACHDEGGAVAGPSMDGKAWILWQPDEDGGTSEPAYSHNIQLEVNCAGCHFENNPWGLELVTGSEYVK